MKDDDLQVAYYERQDESTRLDREARGVLEKLRTWAVLEAALPRQGMVLDIGGGAGVHASWLARNGYQVQMFDPIERHVDQALEVSKQLPDGLNFDVERADAREVPRGDACAEAVLLLGPLYHLHELGDRRQCLAEAFRLLKPGGTLVAAGISRYSWLMDAHRKGLAHESTIQESIDHSLETGHSTPAPEVGSFWAYFHEPSELLDEVKTAGFQDLRPLALEGFAWMLPDLKDVLESEVRSKILLQHLAAVESAPALMGASAHFVVTGRKPRS